MCLHQKTRTDCQDTPLQFRGVKKRSKFITRNIKSSTHNSLWLKNCSQSSQHKQFVVQWREKATLSCLICMADGESMENLSAHCYVSLLPSMVRSNLPASGEVVERCCENVHLSDLPALMIPAQNGDAIPVSYFQRHQKSCRLYRIIPTVCTTKPRNFSHEQKAKHSQEP